MSRINYPAKVLFKSANPVITMLIGLLIFGKKYQFRDYIVVLLLVIGLYVFVSADSKNSPEGTNIGIIFVLLSMLFGAAQPVIQEHLMQTYQATTEELLYFSFLGSTIISFLLSLLAGELFEGLHFLYSQGTFHIWFIFLCFVFVGFFGSNFSTKLTQGFGALVNGLANTVRKAVTLSISFIMFPERNHLVMQHVVGASIFMCGLILRLFFKEEKIHKKTSDHISTSSTTNTNTNTSNNTSYTHTTYMNMNTSSHNLYTELPNNNNIPKTTYTEGIIKNWYGNIKFKLINPTYYYIWGKYMPKSNKSEVFTNTALHV